MRWARVSAWLVVAGFTAGVACDHPTRRFPKSGEPFSGGEGGVDDAAGSAGEAGSAGAGEASAGDTGSGGEAGGGEAGEAGSLESGGMGGHPHAGGQGGVGGTGGRGGTGGVGLGGSAGTAGVVALGGSAGTGGKEPPSCMALSHTCGSPATGSCCASTVLPEGSFQRSNDSTAPAKVSTFRFDVYEVTVGRFRKFVAGYPANKPVAGSGKNPNNPADPGWDASWPLPSSQAALKSAVSCEPGRNDTWTDAPGANESRPMNCLTRYVAGAFCIWDGGRLPTEAEWNYAAAGGNEQRRRPWSNPPSNEPLDPTYAVYQTTLTAAVGAHSPKGDGLWGQADMAGNIWEWVQDTNAPYVTPCTDCANLTAGLDGVIRGGSYAEDGSYLFSWNRITDPPSKLSADIGVRCARTP